MQVCLNILDLVQLVLSQQQTLRALWREAKIDEAFLQAMFKLTFDLLESPVYLKESVTEQKVFEILSQLMSEYGEQIGNNLIKFQQQVIGLLYSKDEEMAKKLADLLGQVTREMKDNQAINFIIDDLV